MSLLELITKIAPIYNNFKSTNIPLDQMHYAWELGKQLNSYITNNNVKPHSLYREIYGKSEGSQNADRKSYIPREFQGRCLRIYKIFKNKKDINKSLPNLISFTLFREAMPFIDNNKFKLIGSKKDELFKLLNSSVAPSRAMKDLRLMLKENIGVTNPRTQKLDELSTEKEIFIDFYNTIFHLKKNDIEKIKKEILSKKLSLEILNDIAVSTNAMAQDGILYNQINFSTTEENIWSAYIDVVINFANEKTPKKIRRFRRIIETRRITQLAEMINDIITILKKNT